MNMTATDTRTRLLNVAEELIQKRGLNAMSFQDLSDAVGIRKASVHHHFANKDEMVHALLNRYLGEFQSAVDEILNSRGNGRKKLKRYFELFLRTLEAGDQDKSCLCGMLVAEMNSLDEIALASVNLFLNNNYDNLKSILNEGANDGSLRKASHPEMILATLEGGLLIARCDGGPKRFSQIMEQLMSVLKS